MGNRVSKTVVHKNAADADSVTTYYVRDAQGNVMAVYEGRKYQNNKVDLTLVEQHIYGSSRLGMRQTNLFLATHSGNVTTTEHIDLAKSGRVLGEKVYQLENHLGNVLAVVSDKKIRNNDGTYSADVVSASDYFPFGAQMPARSTNSSSYRYGYNTQEKTDEISGTGNHYTALFWEYSPRVVHRWNIDPKPNTSFSPYAINQGNPIWFSDPLGDTITITQKTGFLGLGKQTLRYDNGNLYNSDGSAYSGEMKGFLGRTVNALGSLNGTAEGAAMVSELQSSANTFDIRSKSSNKFEPNSSRRASANLAELQAVSGNNFGSTGSGGTIFWNSTSTSGGLDVNGGTTRPAFVGLGHEMAHASDANRGLFHLDRDQTNATTGAVYQSTFNGLKKSEWRAVYRENIIRGQLGLPLRTHYGYDVSSGVSTGIEPRLLTPENQPINYP